jgi:hypothetical protein
MCASLSMFFEQILVNPHYNMILECPFDDLMEQIRCQEFMDVSMRKAMCEWLQESASEYKFERWVGVLPQCLHKFQSHSKASPDPKR